MTVELTKLQIQRLITHIDFSNKFGELNSLKQLPEDKELRDFLFSKLLEEKPKNGMVKNRKTGLVEIWENGEKIGEQG